MQNSSTRSVPLSPPSIVDADICASLDGMAERVLATPSGYLMAFGWLADSASGRPVFALVWNGTPKTWRSFALIRHARHDVEAAKGDSEHDFGFLLLARMMETGGKGPAFLSAASGEAACRMEIEIDLVPERRLLEDALAFLGLFRAHGGRESYLHKFLMESGRQILGDLHRASQVQASRVQHIERFGTARSGASFSTVLFGDMEAALFQPLLFAKAGIAFGEWIYTCNSPEHADELMRIARTTSSLYDLPIKIILLSGNAGFGGANNVAVQAAEANEIVLINPDVHPLAIWADLLKGAFRADRFGNTLRGGLLFYDDDVLMHGGMYLDEDLFVSGCLTEAESLRLLRVEHYDKGVPFLAEDWTRNRAVPAVTGAVMAFDRRPFEALGGFSDDFVYGHYEDADLCLRWSDQSGPVTVDPNIRLVHLEGQGSRTRLPHFHGAAVVNRYIFDARNRHFADADRPQDGRRL